MRMEDLQYFRMLCKHNSFSKAAEKLYISRYALMRSIDSLEEELGGHLFARSSSGIQITVLGEQVLVSAEHILTEYEQMLKLSNKLQANAEKLTIGCYSRNSTSYAFIRCVDSFNKISAACQIEYITCTKEDIRELILNGTIDFGFTMLNSVGPQFASELILTRKLTALVRKNSVYAEKGTVTHNDLLQNKLVMPLMTGGTLRALMDAVSPAIEQNVVVQSNDMGFLYEQVSTNEMIGIFTQRDTGIGAVLFSDLVSVELEPDITTSLGLLYKKHKTLTDLEKKFIFHVKDNYHQWFTG